MRRAVLAVAAAYLLAGCGTEPEAPTGTVELFFSVTGGVRNDGNLGGELDGPVYGAVFHSAEVGVAGPRDGAEAVADVEVAWVDLREDDVSDVSWQSPPLSPGHYTFLGFFDVDESGFETREPDTGDPVTLADSNRFEIVEGENLQFDVLFDLVLF